MLLLMLAGYGSGEAGRSMALQLLKEDAIGLMHLGGPLVARLLELANRGNLTAGDVTEIYSTARELYMKYYDKAPEAWGVLRYAAALIGATRSSFPAGLIRVDAKKWGRLLELLDKDDLTPEEAGELYSLARRFHDEYVEEAPEAVLVLAYARLRVVLANTPSHPTPVGEPTQSPS
jgi:hypothetical protein